MQSSVTPKTTILKNQTNKKGSIYTPPTQSQQKLTALWQIEVIAGLYFRMHYIQGVSVVQFMVVGTQLSFVHAVNTVPI